MVMRSALIVASVVSVVMSKITLITHAILRGTEVGVRIALIITLTGVRVVSVIMMMDIVLIG